MLIRTHFQESSITNGQSEKLDKAITAKTTVTAMTGANPPKDEIGEEPPKQNYQQVAWIREKYGLYEVCESDDPGAFEVYRKLV